MNPVDEPVSAARPLEWTDELVERFWAHRLAHSPERRFSARNGPKIVRRLGRFVPRDALVCDFGFAGGHLMSLLMQRFRVAGVEFTRASVDQANATLSGPRFEGAFHVDDMALLEGRCDGVFFVETVEHLLPHQIAPTFASLSSLLKPGGVVVCTTPNAEDLERNTVYCPLSNRTFHRHQHVHSWRADTLSACFREHGFEPVFAKPLALKAGPLRRTTNIVAGWLGKEPANLVVVARRPVGGTPVA